MITSPPVRRRGLKLVKGHAWKTAVLVASRAEAWIETACPKPSCRSPVVASRAEAWIETGHAGQLCLGVYVASRAEAWIETRTLIATAELPDWGSPPVRRRGLKPAGWIFRSRIRPVASRAEAWIETWRQLRSYR